MHRRRLLALTLGALCTSACPARAEKGTTSEDAAVLEALLMDLLGAKPSVVEGHEFKQPDILRFRRKALTGDLQGPISDWHYHKDQWEKLPKADLRQTEDAIRDVIRRAAAKDPLPDWKPADPRIRLYTEDDLVDLRKKNPLGGQVFSAYPPGYSSDKQLAVVRLSFTWSGGFHGAGGVCVLKKKNGAWTVALRDLIYYV